jgi:hypothetical protein
MSGMKIVGEGPLALAAVAACPVGAPFRCSAALSAKAGSVMPKRGRRGEEPRYGLLDMRAPTPTPTR